MHSDFLSELLQKRGIKDIDVFLNPSYERDLHDPFLMRDMEKACVRIFEAIENKEKIIIYADYDCDGIPGAVILNDLFKKVGYRNYEVYIPQRNSEGYGLNMAAIKQFAEGNAKLVITVDLGITAVGEVAQAEVLGMDVIITDHHLPPAVLPRAYAILNPKVDDYPEKMLCGAGVAFKLAQGFLKKYGEYFKIRSGAEKWMLDMAGLATLSDMVPLTGENRAIAYFGLKVLRKAARPGLQKLFAKMNIDPQYLSEDDVGFMVAPRLNAASRMGDSMQAFLLLAAENIKDAGSLADHLSKINDERKAIVTAIMRDVNKKLEKREAGAEKGVIVIGNPSWRIGILGLVAGKICDQHKKPVFVWGKDENDTIRGSCRSDGSVSVVELMTQVKDYFLDFGGHELAGGFSVLGGKIHFLEEALAGAFHKMTTSSSIPPRLVEEGVGGGDFDLKLSLNHVNMDGWREIEKLSPFGCGNPKPVFLFEGAKIEKVRQFGKNGSGEHLEIVFSDAKNEVKAVSFFSSPDSFNNKLTSGAPVSLFATFDLSRFRGRSELRLRVEDIC